MSAHRSTYGLIANVLLAAAPFIITPLQKPIKKISGVELVDLAKSLDEFRILNFLETHKGNLGGLVDEKGNTFLHLIAEYNTTTILNLVISKLGKKHTTDLCRQVNLEGNTPLRHISNLSLKKNILEAISVLLPFTLDCSIKPITSLVDPQVILNNYPETLTNKDLANNLRMACEAINTVRRFNLKSSTHPDSNFANLKIKTETQDLIVHLRKCLEYGRLDLNEIRELILTSGVANCGEHVALVAASLVDMKKEKTIRFECVKFSNSDHCFGVIGRKNPSDINNPDTWGDSAVIIDSWSGMAFPASKKEFFNSLQGFYRLRYFDETKWDFNFLCNFNPNYHKLETYADYYFQPTLSSYQYYMKFGKFIVNKPPRASKEYVPYFESLLSKTIFQPDISLTERKTFINNKETEQPPFGIPSSFNRGFLNPNSSSFDFKRESPQLVAR